MEFSYEMMVVKKITSSIAGSAEVRILWFLRSCFAQEVPWAENRICQSLTLSRLFSKTLDLYFLSQEELSLTTNSLLQIVWVIRGIMV